MYSSHYNSFFLCWQKMFMKPYVLYGIMRSISYSLYFINHILLRVICIAFFTFKKSNRFYISSPT